MKPSPDRIVVDYAGLPPVTGLPSLDSYLSSQGLKKGEVAAFMGVRKTVGKKDPELLAKLESRRSTPIQTGLQSLDYECALGGHLIVLIGETASGKTAILNTIEKTARRNEQKFVRIREGLGFDEMHVQIANLMGNRSPIKMIEWSGSFGDNMGWVSRLRKELVINNEWAVITVPANRANKGMDTIELAPSEIIRMADYVFSIQKGKEWPYLDKTHVVNVKNRFRYTTRRTASFVVQFKQDVIPTPKPTFHVIAEEINWPLTK